MGFVSRFKRKAAKDSKWLSINEESFHLCCSYKTRQEITQDAAAEQEEVVLRMTLDSASGMPDLSEPVSFHRLLYHELLLLSRPLLPGEQRPLR